MASERYGRTAHLGVAIRPDYHDASIGQSARDELEQFERALIGLVQVIKNHQQWCGTRRLFEQGRDRIEQAKARLLRVGRSTRRDCFRRQLGNQLRYLRRQRRVPFPLAGLVENERAQDLHPGQIGRRSAAFPTSPPRDANTA